jgi:hypothetical protein
MNWKVMRNFRPAIFVFFFLNIGFFSMQSRLSEKGFDHEVLVYGNIILFTIFLVSFMMVSKGQRSKNNHEFFRLMYGSFILKLFLLAGIAFAYIMTMKKAVNKPALFLCMALYVVYTIIEVTALMKSGKQKPHA